MIIMDFRVELHGNKEISINGRRYENGEPMIDEKVIEKQVSTDQQRIVIAMLNKLLAKAQHTYMRSKVTAGEMPMSDYERMMTRTHGVHGTDGVSGTSLGPLPRGK
jgi:hypothetical protein